MSQEILSPGNSVAATIFPRKFCRCVCTMDSHAYFMKEAASSLDISGGTGTQCPLVPPPMSNSAVLRGKVSRCKSATEFPRKCGRYVKIERQNLLGKIVAATEYPGDRISCDTGTPLLRVSKVWPSLRAQSEMIIRIAHMHDTRQTQELVN